MAMRITEGSGLWMEESQKAEVETRQFWSFHFHLCKGVCSFFRKFVGVILREKEFTKCFYFLILLEIFFKN